MTNKSPTYRWLNVLGKTFLYICISLIILLIAGFLFINSKKDQLAKNSLRYVNEEIAGSIEVGSVHIVSLFSYPEIVLNLKDVKVFQPDSLDDPYPVIRVEELDVAANLNEILNNQFNIDFVEINGGFIRISKDTNGSVNISNAFNSPPIPDSLRTDSSTFFLGIDSIAISDFKFVYQDDILKRRLPLTIETLNGELKYMNSQIGGLAKIRSYIDTLSLADSISIPEIEFNIDAEYDIRLRDKTVQVKSNVANLEDVPFDADFMYDYGEIDNMSLAFNSRGRGVELRQGSLKNNEANQTQENIHIQGHVNFTSQTTWRSNPSNHFLQNLHVDLKMNGNELKVIGIDIDNFIEKFKRSQNFNLLDVSAVLLAGPAGLAITKGSDYTVLALGSVGDSCRVNHLESNWVLKGGVLSASDVALSTDNNLVSINGWYNFNKEQLDFDINLVDRYGCSLMTQRYYGAAQQPKTGRVKIIKTFLGPVTNFFRDIGVRNCEVVYSGAVEHPEITAKREKKAAKQKKREDRQKLKHEN